MAQHRPNLGQYRPKLGPMAQHGPNLAQHKPKMGPRWLNMGPTWPNIGTTCAQHRPRLPSYRQALHIMPASVQHSPPCVCAEDLAQSSHTISQKSLLGRRPAVRRKPLNPATPRRVQCSLQLALATRGRTPQNPSGWLCFHVFRGPGRGKKDTFWRIFLFFLSLPRAKTL